MSPSSMFSQRRLCHSPSSFDRRTTKISVIFSSRNAPEPGCRWRNSLWLEYLVFEPLEGLEWRKRHGYTRQGSQWKNSGQTSLGIFLLLALVTGRCLDVQQIVFVIIEYKSSTGSWTSKLKLLVCWKLGFKLRITEERFHFLRHEAIVCFGLSHNYRGTLKRRLFMRMHTSPLHSLEYMKSA